MTWPNKKTQIILLSLHICVWGTLSQLGLSQLQMTFFTALYTASLIPSNNIFSYHLQVFHIWLRWDGITIFFLEGIIQYWYEKLPAYPMSEKALSD